MNNLIFHYDISELEMCKVMDESQIAIVPSSTIAIEAYSRNCLVITGHTINNQIKNYFLKGIPIVVVEGVAKFLMGIRPDFIDLFTASIDKLSAFANSSGVG